MEGAAHMPKNIVIVDETSIYEIDAACMEKRRKNSAGGKKDVKENEKTK